MIKVYILTAASYVIIKYVYKYLVLSYMYSVKRHELSVWSTYMLNIF